MKVVKFHDCKPEIKVGCIVTAFYAGYYKITKVYEDNYGTCSVSYVKVLCANGKKSKHIMDGCHVSYCELVTKDTIINDCAEDIKLISRKYKKLEKILHESQTKNV